MVPAHCCGMEFPTEYAKKALGDANFLIYTRYLTERQWQATNLRSDAAYAATVKNLGGMQCPRCGIGVTRISGCATMHCICGPLGDSGFSTYARFLSERQWQTTTLRSDLDYATTVEVMGDGAFVVVFLRPEIATGYFKFASNGSINESSTGDEVPSNAPSSFSSGVSAVEATFLLPNGHIIPHVLTKIKEEGFEIVQQRMKQFTRAEARQLFSYELQRLDNDEQAFSAFIVAVTRGPSQALLLKLSPTLAKGDVNAAITKWNEVAGAWDPVVARKKALAGSVPHDQWPLRALCGLDAIQNESVRAQVPSKLPSLELPAGLYLNETAGHDVLGFESGLFMSFDSRLNIGNPVDGASFAGIPPKGTPVERTFGIIKPNAASKPEVVDEIVNLIALFGFTVEHQRRLLLTRDQASEFYAEHRVDSWLKTRS
ncbi:hypothetical protein BBJ29_007951 [Phytophthora kernoviae]|uniref:Nucleoside diphosphate kinase-like domain-containing protein n=1 Tax=Phytophthora kernoviae TaxID=325452 RepID=A0A3R7IWY6_9STRA|nr:hypothetical protein BBJ29_007951 [Phytophthora kernoviae]